MKISNVWAGQPVSSLYNILSTTVLSDYEILIDYVLFPDIC